MDNSLVLNASKTIAAEVTEVLILVVMDNSLVQLERSES